MMKLIHDWSEALTQVNSVTTAQVKFFRTDEIA